jgi:hypothetical protein
MKRLFILFLAIVGTIGMVHAANVTLGWDLNPADEMIEKYFIYQASGTNSFTLLTTIPGTVNLYTIRNVVPGKYRFMILATNAVGTSVPSSEIVIPTKSPSKVTNIRSVDNSKPEK